MVLTGHHASSCSKIHAWLVLPSVTVLQLKGIRSLGKGDYLSAQANTQGWHAIFNYCSCEFDGWRAGLWVTRAIAEYHAIVFPIRCKSLVGRIVGKDTDLKSPADQDFAQCSALTPQSISATRPAMFFPKVLVLLVPHDLVEVNLRIILRMRERLHSLVG